MRQFFNPDYSCFKRTVESEIYVDKTGLLEYTNRILNTEQSFICNSRPRRFGKSITAHMLTAYYSKGCDSSDLFKSFAISKCSDYEKHLNQYNVIHLDIQWCAKSAGDYKKTVSYIHRIVVQEIKLCYPELEIASDELLYNVMAKIYKETGEKFIVIIDEWDTLLRDCTFDEKIQNEYIDFLSGMFKGTEPAKYISLAFLTGILPMKRMKTQSTLNNFDEYTMLSPKNFAPYIGFTKEEVEQLCLKYGRCFDTVKMWYDGYRLSGNGKKYRIYNPKAVVSVMLWGDFQSYWSQTGSFETIEGYINRDMQGLKQDIIAMIAGGEIKVNVLSFRNDIDEKTFKQKDDIMTFLIHLGYLAYNPERKTVYIPNEEVRQEFINATKDSRWQELQNFENESMKLLNATLDLEEKLVAENIEEIHSNYTSIMEYNDENSLSCVVTIAYLASINYYFRPIRELPTGRGYADLVYLPRPEYNGIYPALLIELKWNQNAEAAIHQIEEKKYPTAFLQYTGEILLVGINYDKKSKQHECVIKEIKKQV